MQNVVLPKATPAATCHPLQSHYNQHKHSISPSTFVQIAHIIASPRTAPPSLHPYITLMNAYHIGFQALREFSIKWAKKTAQVINSNKNYQFVRNQMRFVRRNKNIIEEDGLGSRLTHIVGTIAAHKAYKTIRIMRECSWLLFVLFVDGIAVVCHWNARL